MANGPVHQEYDGRMILFRRQIENYLHAISQAYAGLRLDECRCDVVIGDKAMFLDEELHIPAGFRTPGNE